MERQLYGEPGGRPEARTPESPEGEPYLGREPYTEGDPYLGGEYTGGEPYAPGAAASPAPERSIGSLFRQLSRELGTLLRQESALARAEIRERAGTLGSGIAALAGGAALAFAGLLILLEAAMHALAGVVGSLALSGLIVGGAAALIGALVLFAGRRRIRAEEMVPRRSLESLRHDVEIITGNGHADPWTQ